MEYWRIFLVFHLLYVGEAVETKHAYKEERQERVVSSSGDCGCDNPYPANATESNICLVLVDRLECLGSKFGHCDERKRSQAVSSAKHELAKHNTCLNEDMCKCSYHVDPHLSHAAQCNIVIDKYNCLQGAFGNCQDYLRTKYIDMTNMFLDSIPGCSLASGSCGCKANIHKGENDTQKCIVLVDRLDCLGSKFGHCDERKRSQAVSSAKHELAKHNTCLNEDMCKCSYHVDPHLSHAVQCNIVIDKYDCLQGAFGNCQDYLRTKYIDMTNMFLDSIPGCCE